MANKELVGLRVRMTGPMFNDPDPIPVGSEGTIAFVDDGDTFHVDWDNGRTLGLLPSDPYSLIPAKKVAD
jgi:hypothetical protein